MKLCSFDIETATLTPDDDDPHKYRPLGIACAATQLVDTSLGALGVRPAIAWASFSDGAPDPDAEMYGNRMSPYLVGGLVQYLMSMKSDGYIPLTWNGLNFDFDILAEESVEYGEECARLANTHYDMAFQMLCDKGYMVGMQAAALGLGLSGKSEGMHGDLAPVMWARSRADQDRVLEYVKQDVQTTTEIAMKLIETKKLVWTSKKGKRQEWDVDKLLTVEESLRLPEPDTSWMTNPRTRNSCLRWTNNYLKVK